MALFLLIASNVQMKTFLKFFLPLLFILVLVESGLHLVEAFTPSYYIGNESGKGFKARAINMFLQEQINRLWIRTPEERKTILEPPFQVFINKNFEDQERMDFIFKHSALPPLMNVTAPNFLRLNQGKETFTFTATTNSLSFRGGERDLKKTNETFRIILLGSYPAFGHGADDAETYASIIEKNFRDSGTAKKVEVWNGGRQGGTSIMGYARLLREIERYSPDLILWDYGWIELYLANDRVRNNPRYATIRNDTTFDKMVFNICLKTILGSLKICTFSVRKLTKVSYSDAISGWKESMTRVREWASSKNLPVIFVRHMGVTIAADEYEAFHAPEKKFIFADTSPSVKTMPSNEEVEDFWSRDNWLSELGFSREEVMAQEPQMVFFGDAIQYNKHGYKRIGDYLYEIIRQTFPQTQKKGRK